MNKNIDIEAAQGAAINLVGTLDLLASLHATAAASDPHGGDTAALAAAFALLHASAARLSEMLTPD